MGGSTRKHAKARRRLFGKKSDGAGLELPDGVPEPLPPTGISKENISVPTPTASKTEALKPKDTMRKSYTGKDLIRELERVGSSIFANSNNNNDKDNCLICGLPSNLFCSACREATYCSTDHQLKHWTVEHSKVCYPCQDMEEEELEGWKRPFGPGPYLKATKDLSAFEVIYEDRSLMTGPGCSGVIPYEPVCLGCNEILPKWKLCELCDWPLCEKCPKKSMHENYECPIFARNRVQELLDPFQYELVRILRCLMTRVKDPVTFKQLTSLYGALEKREKSESLIEATKTACMFIQGNCKLLLYDEDLINQICGVVHMQTRPFGKNSSGMEIFPFASKLLHACDANTRFIDKISPTGEVLLQVVAIREIKKGEPLTQRLIVDMEPSFLRQRFLMDYYYFTCNCSLCKDPTERCTYLSGVKCYGCKTAGKVKGNLGYFLPLDPTDIDSGWSCNQCKATLHGSTAAFRIESSMKRFVSFKEKNLHKLNLKEIIAAIRTQILEAEEEFHPSSFIAWRLKQYLAATLTGLLITMTPIVSWDEVHAIFTELHEAAIRSLTILQLLQPGSSVERGETAYDLVVASWAYCQWVVLFGKSKSFELIAAEKGFYTLQKEVTKIFEGEVVSGKKAIADAVQFIVNNTEYIKAKIEELGLPQICTEKVEN